MTESWYIFFIFVAFSALWLRWHVISAALVAAALAGAMDGDAVVFAWMYVLTCLYLIPQLGAVALGGFVWGYKSNK